MIGGYRRVVCEYDTGVEFIDMRPEDREKISEIVEEILKKQKK